MTQIGAPKHEPINIGTEATPPFAVCPDPSTLFQKRAKRFETLAPGHDLVGYLSFIGLLCQFQHHVCIAADTVVPPAPERQALAKAGAMPPLARDDFAVSAGFQATLDHLLDLIAASGDGVTAQAKVAAQALAGISQTDLQLASDAVLAGRISAGGVAETVLLAAALQVHFSRLAAAIDAGQLQPVADGVCPACGAPPVSSSVVGWPNAENTRFCTCSLCATQWNVVRVKCVSCGSTGGISYLAIEGQPGTIKGESCQACKSYVKILYQVNDPALDPVADDVATLALDLLLAERGWLRCGVNPFLTGYAPAASSGDESV